MPSPNIGLNVYILTVNDTIIGSVVPYRCVKTGVSVYVWILIIVSRRWVYYRLGVVFIFISQNCHFTICHIVRIYQLLTRAVPRLLRSKIWNNMHEKQDETKSTICLPGIPPFVYFEQGLLIIWVCGQIGSG